MHEKIFILIVISILSIIIDIFLRRFYKNIFILHILVFFGIFFCFIFFNINTLFFFETIYYVFIYLIFYSSYNMILIAIVKGSPTLKILEILHYNPPLNQKKLKILFKKKSFIKSRINDLLKRKYIKKENSFYIYEKKNLFLFKFLIFIRKMQNLENKENG